MTDSHVEPQRVVQSLRRAVSTGMVRKTPFHDPVKRGTIVSVHRNRSVRGHIDRRLEALDDERPVRRDRDSGEQEECQAQEPARHQNFTWVLARSVSAISKNSLVLNPNMPAMTLDGNCWMRVFRSPHDGVVVPPRALHGLLDLRERALQLSEVLRGAKLRISLGEREEAAQRSGQGAFSLRALGRPAPCADTARLRALMTASSV